MTEKETDDIIEKTLDRVMPLALKAMSKRFREWRSLSARYLGTAGLLYIPGTLMTLMTNTA